LFNDDLLAATISKLLRLAQGNAAKLDTVLENQAKFQETLDAQQKDILAIKAKIEPQPEEEKVKKGKGKGKANDDFYRVSIPIFLHHF
jgi:ABC-type transporter Mla subunit MlaD